MKCKSCNEEKDESEYYNADKRCKECRKAIVRDRYKKDPTKYDYSEKGVIRVIYKTQVRHSILRGHDLPDYSKDELKYWMYNNNFKLLYDNWVESGYKKDKKPSIDRLDTFKGYFLNNLRLVTWLDNREAQYHDIRNAIGTGSLRCKAVNQFDMDGVFISEFASQRIAEKETGISHSNISCCCVGKAKTAGGYRWGYA